ncbi:MAG: DUF3499 family protein [Actinobacteria bacterium]|nr:MAG: DUF3499 family protein [Actinomycetota bacterium]REK42236.1 MAG: DUF3499 family protein [Actinomycetota bacterium]
MLVSCTRCNSPAAVMMTFNYTDSAVWLDDMTTASEPYGYPLCANHGDRMTPPHGWTLTDRRTTTRLFAPLSVA